MRGVVIGQFCSTFALAVGCGDLTRQVLIAVRCVQDVEGHHGLDLSDTNVQVGSGIPECQ